MSYNSEMVDDNETPLAAVIDDSCTVEYIEITPLVRPSDDCSLWLSAAGDCYQLGSIEPVVEVKPEDLQDVKQEPADETDNEDHIPHYAVKVRFCESGLFFYIFKMYCISHHNTIISKCSGFVSLIEVYNMCTCSVSVLKMADV